MKRNIILASLISAAVLCLVMASDVKAQQSPLESKVEELNKAVTLTADQRTKILKIYTDAVTNVQQGGGGLRGGATTAAVEKVLTPDQLKKWNAYNSQQSVDKMMTQIDEAVTLTADQKKKITPIIKKIIQVQNDMAAEMSAQGEKADFKAIVDKYRPLISENQKALRSILTKEQLEKLEAWDKEKHVK